jgi:predicted lipoprotein with Yx(FWY)xxD motif
MNRRTLMRRIAITGSVGLLGSVAGCASRGSTGGDDGESDTATSSPRDGATPTTGGSEPTGTPTGDGPMTTTATPSGKKPMRFPATVNVFSDEKWGDILVGPNGLSLYLFVPDKPGNSMCYGRCARVWPPLIATQPTKSDAVTATIGTITRKDGSSHVAADCIPLYYYAPDKEPGDTKGQDITGFGGEWYLVAPDGSPVEEAAHTTTSTTSNPPTTTNSSGY